MKRNHDLLTLVFTAAIMISTVVYAIVSVRTLMEIQSGSADTHNLAIAAKAQVDPILHETVWLGTYHLEESREVFVSIKMQNDGKTIADSPSIAVRMQFRNSPPAMQDREFADKDFESLGTQYPFVIPYNFDDRNFAYYRKVMENTYSKFLGKETYFYVWGQIRSKDYAGDFTRPRNFCRYAPAKDVLAALPGDPAKVSANVDRDKIGYAGPYQGCN